MGVVWGAHISSLIFIQSGSLEDGNSPAQIVQCAEHLDGREANSIALVQRMIEANVYLKGITNRQSIITVAIGMAFGLMAIGCGLFVLGIQGGFEAEARTPQNGSLVLKSSAPGILCFVLGTLIILVGLSRPEQIAFKDSELEKTGTRADKPIRSASQDSAKSDIQPAAPDWNASLKGPRKANDLPDGVSGQVSLQNNKGEEDDADSGNSGKHTTVSKRIHD
jgi:hypothetical protein